MKLSKIFSGEYSRDMWDAINSAKTKGDLRTALYFVCCRLQELESRLDSSTKKKGYKMCKHDECEHELRICQSCGNVYCVKCKAEWTRSVWKVATGDNYTITDKTSWTYVIDRHEHG